MQDLFNQPDGAGVPGLQSCLSKQFVSIFFLFKFKRFELWFSKRRDCALQDLKPVILPGSTIYIVSITLFTFVYVVSIGKSCSQASQESWHIMA